MTNATDVLCVGGPADGRMSCINNASSTTVIYFPQDGGPLAYFIRKWWHPDHRRWYWIATGIENIAMPDVTIIAALVATQMQPAWDLKDLPAPSSGNTQES